MNIYVDTGASFALSDSRDMHHGRASEYALRMERQNRFLTSSYVIVEAWLLIRNKLGYHIAMGFLERIRGGGVQIEHVTVSDLDKAAKILALYSDQQFSLVDAVSFVIMERLNISHAFSFDVHFQIYRFGAKNERRFTVVP